jgi:glycosyltransferase involved in cell wall biosynthesis
VNPLRILKVMPFYEPATQYGGAVSQAGQVCAELARRGHVVRVLTTDMGQAPDLQRDRWIEREGCLVYYATTRPWHRVVPYWTPTLAKPLRHTLPETDVLALNVGLTLTNRIASRLAVKLGVPYVYNAEGALCPLRLRLKRFSKAVFLRLVERPLLIKAAACQALTDKDAEDLVAQGVPRTRIAKIPNGILPLRTEGGSAFRLRHGIDAQAPLLLFLGRLHHIKGLDVLIQAFAQCEDRDAQLVLAGADGDGSGARALALASRLGVSDRVFGIGHLETEDKLQALDAADLFVLTSRTEGLPIAVLEALAAGLPCLLTDACNVPEVAQAGAGRVVPLEIQRIVGAMDELLADTRLREEMGLAARLLAQETFSLESVVIALEDLYRRVQAGHANNTV